MMLQLMRLQLTMCQACCCLPVHLRASKDVGIPEPGSAVLIQWQGSETALKMAGDHEVASAVIHSPAHDLQRLRLVLLLTPWNV